MRGLSAFAACVALCSVSSAALAADPSTEASLAERFYVSFHGGYVFNTTSDDTATDADPTTGIPLVGPTYVVQGISKPGYRVGGSVGKQFGDAFGIEAEVSYAAASIDHVHIVSVSGVPVNVDQAAAGSGSTWTGMVNALVTLPAGGFRPYIGAGIGMAYFTANNIVSPPGSPPGSGAVLNGSDTGFAYQFLSGVNFDLMQGSSVGARYRYVKVTNLSLMDGGYRHDFSTTAQSVEVVLTRHFGN